MIRHPIPVRTFGRWEKAAGNENAGTGATEDPEPIAHLRKVSRKRGKSAHLRKVGRGESATTRKTKEEECRNGSESWDSVPLWKGDERAMPFTGAVTRDAAKQGLRNGTESRDLLPLRKQNRNFYYL